MCATDNIVAQQNREVLYSLYEHMDAAFYCINKFHAIIRSRNKYNQLRAALASGIKIPKTVIGKEKNALRYLASEGVREAIKKASRQIVIQKEGKPWSFFTKRAECNMAREESEAPLSTLSLIAQEYIKPKYEIRCLVLGCHIQATKISTLCRSYDDINEVQDVDKEYESLVLSEQFHDKIHHLMKTMGLEIGCVDFIVDDNDDIYFLEINEAGQFLFVERCNSDIACLDSVCRFLCEKAGADKETLDMSTLHYQNFHDVLLTKFEEGPDWVEDFALV